MQKPVRIIALAKWMQFSSGWKSITFKHWVFCRKMQCIPFALDTMYTISKLTHA